MQIIKHEPLFSPVQWFITRFFVAQECIFEQETKIPLPTLMVGDMISIFDMDYIVKQRQFGFNEDAFFTVYALREDGVAK